MYRPEQPLIVQADRSILAEVNAPLFAEARAALASFAELEKSPEHVHTYRLTPLSIWNATAAGLSGDAMIATLAQYSKYDLPPGVVQELLDLAGRWGSLRLERDARGLVLRAVEGSLAEEIGAHREIAALVGPRQGASFAVDADRRGPLKRALVKLGFPVDDHAGFEDGAPLPIALRERTLADRPFALRRYQLEAASIFGGGGHGVIVLPCGAGKTVVGLGAMAALGMRTLILTTGILAARQWRREILDKTTLTEDEVGEYSGEKKEIRPVTITTYSILTKRQGEAYPHFARLDGQGFGLVIYDEVHLLPAPVFRLSADLQARRRLGLTATLIREDGREGDVFSLIGPKRYEVPWKEMEAQGFIAEASCYELRVETPPEVRLRAATADEKGDEFRIAATSPTKLLALREIAARHAEDSTLVIGVYLDQLADAGKLLGAPVVTGETPQRERARLFEAFRRRELPVLIASRIANFALDLPEANVCVQLSGTFGSRQEEAQRLGRVLRPKADGRGAVFYTLVARDTCEQRFALNRQLFLTEQGYRYFVEDWSLAPPGSVGAGGEVGRLPS